jgi:hypothetical protein
MQFELTPTAPKDFAQKEKIPPTAVGGWFRSHLQRSSFFARRAQRAGRFPQSNQRLIETGFDLMPPARFARFPKEFSSS